MRARPKQPGGLGLGSVLVGESLALALVAVQCLGPATAQPVPDPVPRPAAAELNSAGLEISLLPSNTVAVGQDFTFRVITRRPGYLVLIDVNAEGTVTQLYPNVFSMKLVGQIAPSKADPCLSVGANTLSSFGLAGGGNVQANHIDTSQPFELPGTRQGTGYAFQACPPRGRGMIMAILSDRPVQIVDLPDIPKSTVGEKAGFDLIVNGLRSLRLISGDQPDQPAIPRWSITSQAYSIQ